MYKAIIDGYSNKLGATYIENKVLLIPAAGKGRDLIWIIQNHYLN